MTSDTFPSGEASLEALVERTLGALAEHERDTLLRTIAAGARASVRPPAAGVDTGHRRRLASLAEDALHRDVVAGIDIGETLGEGGMGLVRLGRQRSLDREVAVKTLKPGARSEEGVARLLREAWVTGSLEHPNIVPVYDLGLDVDGAPVIVLKRIQGEAWSRFIGDREAAEKRFGGGDLLEQNLRVFVQVCNAVALAHARGVLHVDLKPDNVMMGSFGEVYLVDWGIAQTLASATKERRGPIGTPAYMAPEMLDGEGALTPRTDVYLLGAILHEMLSGRAPHEHATVRQVLASILFSTPTFPVDAPQELVAVARRAMQRKPEDRFASVEELRGRVEWYLRHRSSLALSDEAHKTLATLRDTTRSSVGVAPPPEREKVYRLFAEARFGFRQALAASTDNETAREGVRQTFEVVATWELEHGTARGAAAALAELPDPPHALAERVATALSAEQARDARLRDLERDIDPNTDRWTRALAGLAMGAVWTLFPLAMWWLDRPEAGRWAKHSYLVTIALAALTVLVTLWARPTLTRTMVNRRALYALRTALASQLALEVAASALDIPLRSAMVLHFVVWFTTSTAYSVLVDPRAWPGAASFLLCLVLAVAFPAWVWGISVLAVVGLLLSAALGLRGDGRA